MLIEVHVLQNHAPSNLNRDDTGSPKEAMFGGYRRARISSQCIKRSIRRSELFQQRLENLLATRTRSLPELVREKLLSAGLDKDTAEEGAKKASGIGNKEGKERKPNRGGYYRTAQTILLTKHDIEVVASIIEEAAKAGNLTSITPKGIEKKAQERGFQQVTVDIGLFGRMVTSEAFVDVEASCQFAHAISTHKVDHEFDYFTAVDDLTRESDDEAGAGADMIGDIEFNSACYYKYFNVHHEGLVDNLTGKALGRSNITEEDEKNTREIAARAICALIEAACRVTPSGKQNSFAAHQYPSVLWIEVRDDNLPVSYANAFCNPVNPKAKDGLELESAKALKEECENLTKMFGLHAKKRYLLTKHKGFEILGVKPSESLSSVLNDIYSLLASAESA